MLHNIKYLLVISHSEGYPLPLIVTYSTGFAYYALVLGDRPFPNLFFCQILLFGMYLRKYVNNLVITLKKSTFANFTDDFSCKFNWTKSVLKKLIYINSTLSPGGTRLIDINYLKLCNTLLQIWCIRCYTQFAVLYKIWKSISYSLL